MVDPRNDPIREEAIDWLLKIQAAPEDPVARAALDAWCARSEAHEAAYRSVSRMWRVSGKLPTAYAEAARSGRPGTPVRHRSLPLTQRPRAGRRVAAAVAAIGIAACLVFAVAPTIGVRLQADFAAGTGEVRNITLKDGSALHLDAESAVSVDFAGTRRAVTLLSGQAYFDVVRDTERPFTVAADDLVVTVRGTGFAVRSAPDSVTVAVAEGKVDVSPHGRDKESVFLGPGDRIRFDRRSGAIGMSRIAPGDVASWRDGHLVSSGMSFRDLAEYIGRYRPGSVLVADSHLADRRITGVFNLTDPAAALRVAAETQNAQVTEITPYLLVVRPR